MNRRIFLALLALSFALIPFCLAAAPAAKPAGSVTPIVTVTKTDRSTVRGKLTAAGPGSITVEVTAAAAPAQIAWRDIKSVSNGLTQAKALQQFSTEHADQLCETCHGNTSIRCATCKGTGHDPASGKDCKTCKGELLVDCKNGADGKMPCPNRCLKLTEGKWEKHDDGLRWRMFGAKGHASMTYSERHLGQVIYINKSGEVVNEGECPLCKGTTNVSCTTCDGMGKVPCATCVARKDAPSCPTRCDKGRETCKACDGTGLKGSGPASSSPPVVNNDSQPAESGGPKSSPPPVPTEPEKTSPLPF